MSQASRVLQAADEEPVAEAGPKPVRKSEAHQRLKQVNKQRRSLAGKMHAHTAKSLSKQHVRAEECARCLWRRVKGSCVSIILLLVRDCAWHCADALGPAWCDRELLAFAVRAVKLRRKLGLQRCEATQLVSREAFSDTAAVQAADTLHDQLYGFNTT